MNTRTIYISALLFVVTFVWIFTFARIQVDPLHDGILFKPAVDVAHGRILYRDSLTQYGMLTTFIQSFFLKIFGESVLVMKTSAVFFYSLAAVTFYFVWKKVFSQTSVLMGYFIWFGTFYFYFPNDRFLAWSSVYALFFQSLGLLFMLMWMERKKWLFLFTAGICIALVFWCRQTVGIFSTVGALAFLFHHSLMEKKKWKTLLQKLIPFVAGILVASFPFILYIGVNDVLFDWWKQTFAMAAAFAEGRSISPFGLEFIVTRLFPGMGVPHFFVFWSLFPIAGILLLFGFFLKVTKRTQQDWKYHLFALFLLSSWLQYYPMSDPLHWHWAMSLFMPVLPWFWWKIWEVLAQVCQLRKWQRRNAILILAMYITFSVLATLPFFILIGVNAYKKLASPYVTISNPPYLVGMLLSPEEATKQTKVMDILSQYFSLYPHKSLVNVSYSGMYSLLPHYQWNHPMFIYFDFVERSVYPGYSTTLDAYVRSLRPVIVEQDIQFGKNYCRSEVLGEAGMRLAFPKEDVQNTKLASICVND